MRRSRPMRVPDEFKGWIDGLSEDFSKQTGLPKDNTATMRRMANKLDGRLIVKGLDFDFAILGRMKKKKDERYI